MGRVVLYLYTGKYEASTVPKMYPELASDPSELDREKLVMPQMYTVDEEEAQPGDDDTMQEDDTTLAVPARDTHDSNTTLRPTATTPSEGEAVVQANMEAAAKRLKVNVMVYKIADYLEIPKLAALASDNFMEDSQFNVERDGYVDPLGYMYENLPPFDRKLRLRITHWLSQHYEKISKMPVLTQALEYHTDGVWHLFKIRLDDQKRVHEEKLTTELDLLLRTMSSSELRCQHRSRVEFRSLTPDEIAATHTDPSQRQRWVFEYSCRHCTMRYLKREPTTT